MSMDSLRNAHRRDAEQIAASIAQDRHGIVASVDPTQGAVRLKLQPEGILTGWIPDCSFAHYSGGVGIVAPLSLDDQVIVGFLHGDADHPYVSGRMPSNTDTPPVSPITGKPVQPGEVGVFLPGGAFLHAINGVWHLKGDLIVDGDVSDKHGSLDRLRGNYDAHDHEHSVGPTTKPDAE